MYIMKVFSNWPYISFCMASKFRSRARFSNSPPSSSSQLPTARPRSLISGERMDKIDWGPNWEELLGGEFEKRARDRNFEAMQKEM
jgi:nitrate reductase beta subunit